MSFPTPESLEQRATRRDVSLAIFITASGHFRAAAASISPSAANSAMPTF